MRSCRCVVRSSSESQSKVGMASSYTHLITFSIFTVMTINIENPNITSDYYISPDQLHCQFLHQTDAPKTELLLGVAVYVHTLMHSSAFRVRHCVFINLLKLYISTVTGLPNRIGLLCMCVCMYVRPVATSSEVVRLIDAGARASAREIF